MAISEGTQPAPLQWTGAWTTAQTTASFVPEAGALLVALVAGDAASGAPTAAISDSIDGTAQWVLLRRQNTAATGLAGTCEVWCRDSPNVAMTVSVTGTGTLSNGGQMVVKTLIGALAKASQNGAVNGASPKAAVVQVSVAAGTGNRIYGAAFNYVNSTAMTVLANTTAQAFADTTNNDDWEAFKSSGDTAGTAIYGYSTSTDGMIAAVEIKAAGGTPANVTPAVLAVGSAVPAPAVGSMSGPNWAGTVADGGGGTGTWTSPTNAQGAADSTYTTWAVP